jgi:predicted mannosyl-3-phosphoglycerate phosphatase (HAD superfamily)
MAALDSTTYSYEAALPALTAPASKAFHSYWHRVTRMEMEPLRQRLDFLDPFIVENGGAVFVPLASSTSNACTRSPTRSLNSAFRITCCERC